MKRTDSMRVALPRFAQGSLLFAVLEDLYQLYLEGVEKGDSFEVTPVFDPKQIVVEEWGETDLFEKLVQALVSKYEQELADVLGDKEPQDLDLVSSKKKISIGFKKRVAESLCNNIGWRVSASLDEKIGEKLGVLSIEEKIFLVRPVGGNSFAKKQVDGQKEQGEQNWTSYIG